MHDPTTWTEPEPDSITFDSDIVAMESNGEVLRVTTESGRVYTIHRLPGTPKRETHA